jgi:hypothetical protein
VSRFSSVTTGLVHKGVEIPKEGLERSWFNPKYELRTTDILPIYDRERKRNKVKEPALYLYNTGVMSAALVYEDGLEFQFEDLHRDGWVNI